MKSLPGDHNVQTAGTPPVAGSIPRVSVIIPAYNQAHFLGEAVDSVLAQTMVDYEIIVIDDGSTDNTPEVARRYGDSIRYIRQENQGLAGARNTGINQARGELIGLLDSDDAWLPGFLEHMVDLADRHPAGTVFYCPVQYIGPDGQDLPQWTPNRPVTPEKMYATLLRANFLVPSAILMQRAAVVEAGLFDPNFHRLEDWDLWLRLLRQGHRFIGSELRLVLYRQHGHSLSRDPRRMLESVLAVVRKQFGEDDGQPHTWTVEKRRVYSGAYRYGVLAPVKEKDDWRMCAEYLRRMLACDPAGARDIDLFYELALGAQPVGFRGTAQGLNLSANLQRVGAVLQATFAAGDVAGDERSPDISHLRRTTYATAYAAGGRVAYNQGALRESRRYLWDAIRYRPALAFGPQAGGLLVKALVGRGAIGRWRNMRRALQRMLRQDLYQ